MDESVVAEVRASSTRPLSHVDEEIKALEAEIATPGAGNYKEEKDFWLLLPRFGWTGNKLKRKGGQILTNL